MENLDTLAPPLCPPGNKPNPKPTIGIHKYTATNQDSRERDFIDSHPILGLLTSELKKLREESENNNKGNADIWKRMDFLEKYALSRASYEIEYREKQTPRKTLPKIPEVFAKDKDKLLEFEGIWKQFASSDFVNDADEARERLNQLFDLWSNNSRGFNKPRSPY